MVMGKWASGEGVPVLVSTSCVLRVYRLALETAKSAMEDEGILAAHGDPTALGRGGQRDGEVHDLAHRGGGAVKPAVKGSVACPLTDKQWWDLSRPQKASRGSLQTIRDQSWVMGEGAECMTRLATSRVKGVTHGRRRPCPTTASHRIILPRDNVGQYASACHNQDALTPPGRLQLTRFAGSIPADARTAYPQTH